MGVSVGPKMPVIRSLGPTSAGTQDGTFNNSANWGVTPGSLGDSDNWAISGGVASIDGSQSDVRWLINQLTQNKYYKIKLDIVSYSKGTLSLSYGTGGTTSGTEMYKKGSYVFTGQVTGNAICYIRAGSTFIGSIDNVEIEEVDESGNPISPLILSLDAANAKSYAGEPTVNFGAYYYEALSSVGTETVSSGKVRSGKVRDGYNATTDYTQGTAVWDNNHPKARVAYEIRNTPTAVGNWINSGVDSGDWEDEAHAIYVFDEILKKPVIQTAPIDSTYGTSGFGGWRAKSFGVGRTWAQMGVDAGVSYTISWLQWSNYVSAYWRIGLYDTLEGGSSNTFHDGLSDSSNNNGQIVAGVWERKSHTISSAADWTQASAPSMYCYGHYTPAVYSTMRITDIQVEVKGYRTPTVEGVAITNSYEGARSATNGWKDLSRKGNHGTLTNMVGTGAAHYKKGKTIHLEGNNTSAYLDFDGSNDNVAVSHTSDFTTAKTWVLWFKLDSIPASGSYDSIFQSSDDWNSAGGISLQMIYGNFTWSWGNNFNGACSVANSTLSTGVWIHFVGTSGGDTESNAIKMYLDGELKDTGTAAQIPDDTPSNITIGSGSGGGFDGKIAVFQVYTEELTHKQIKEMYESQKSRFGL